MTPPRPAPDGVDARAWAGLFAPAVAHRGLWGPGQAPENSLAAFEAAAADGYGMELDVQLSADGEAMVFHDDRLDQRRLTGASGRVAGRRAAELAQVRLAGTSETIPTLGQALDRVGGRSLVLVELKVLDGEGDRLARRVAETLDAYAGPVAVLSFDPHALAWFAAHRPATLRGLNGSAYHDALNWAIPAEERQALDPIPFELIQFERGEQGRRSFAGARSGRKTAHTFADRALAELEHVALARPHFLGLGLEMLPSPSAEALRAGGLPVLAWTVRSPEDWARVKDGCDNMMFEGFRP